MKAFSAESTSRSRGFSLIEVLAAVAIIGILVFLAIPNVVVAKRDAEEQYVITRAESLNMATSQYISAVGRVNAASQWASKTNEQRYTLIKGYLAYAPNTISVYQPNGYTLTLADTPDAKVTILRANGTATPDSILY